MKATAIRILVYKNNTQEALDKQLGQSMPDGIRTYPTGTITIFTAQRSGKLRLFWNVIKELWR